ncbi:MAG: LapA family protein [Actinomycetota bacterium]|nr:LapA family protein [Actinomycetota bacterium]
MAGEETAKRERAALRERLGGGLGLVLVALVGAFAALNLDEVRVNWALGTWRTPLIVVIAVSLGLGIAIGALAARRKSRRDA